MQDTEPRKRNKTKADTHAQSAPLQAVVESVPAFKEGTEPKVIYCKTQDDEGVPKNRIGRWLYHRSQIFLGVLTFGVLIIYGALWWDGRRTRELENRAYVAVKAVRLEQQPANPGWSDVVVVFANTGRTPGVNGTVTTDFNIRESPVPDEAEFSPSDKLGSKIVLASQIDIVTRVGSVQNALGEITERQQAAEKAQINESGKSATPHTTPVPVTIPMPTPDPNQKKYFYVWGRVDYEDIFGGKHRTRFCFFNIPGTGGWNACPAHNSFN